VAKIDVIRNALIYQQPFFASVLMRHPMKASHDVTLSGIDSEGCIYYHPENFAALTDLEALFVLCHEVMHAVCLHHVRGEGKNPELWNIAADAFINAFLKKERVGVMPEGGVDIPGSEDRTTEEIYQELLRRREGGKEEVPKLAERDLPCTNPKLRKALSPAAVSEITCAQKIENASARSAAKTWGRLSGGLDRLINAVAESRVPWHEVLEKFFTSRASQHLTWQRPNRRYETYMPSRLPAPALGTVVIGIDTSGSVSGEMLQEFAGHVNAVMESCRPERIYVVYCDAGVQKVEEFTEDDLPIEFHAPGGGGTDMTQILRFAEEEKLYPDVCCILTDGLTPFADAPFPVLWCIAGQTRPGFGESDRIKSPFGETVYVE
jgi:predicted metal-dependent peptidase